MTLDKDGREKVNRISLKNKIEWYTKEELGLLTGLGIECTEVIWSDRELKEHEESLEESKIQDRY